MIGVADGLSEGLIGETPARTEAVIGVSIAVLAREEVFMSAREREKAGPISSGCCCVGIRALLHT